MQYAVYRFISIQTSKRNPESHKENSRSGYQGQPFNPARRPSGWMNVFFQMPQPGNCESIKRHGGYNKNQGPPGLGRIRAYQCGNAEQGAKKSCKHIKNIKIAIKGAIANYLNGNARIKIGQERENDRSG